MNRILPYILIVGSLLFVQASTAFAANQPQLIFAYENKENYPAFTGNDAKIPGTPGIYVEIMRLVAEQLDIDLKLVRLPWPRVLASLKEGSVDAANGSYKVERDNYVDYPRTQNQEIDYSRHITHDAYRLYVPKDSSLRWQNDTLQFSVARQSLLTIGIPSGYSVGELLNKTGVSVHQSVVGFDALASMLLLSRVDGIVVHERPFEYYLDRHKEIAARVKTPDPAIVEKFYFIMLGEQFVARYPDLSEKIWDTIRTVRETHLSKLYKKYRYMRLSAF